MNLNTTYPFYDFNYLLLPREEPPLEPLLLEGELLGELLLEGAE